MVSSVGFYLNRLGGPNILLAIFAEEVASGLGLVLFGIVLGFALGLHVWEITWRKFDIEVVAWEIFVEENSARRSLGTDASKGDESGDLHTIKKLIIFIIQYLILVSLSFFEIIT